LFFAHEQQWCHAPFFHLAVFYVRVAVIALAMAIPTAVFRIVGLMWAGE
jgi:hypothetical protein